MFKKLIRICLRPFLGVKRFQHLFETLQRLSLQGMNALNLNEGSFRNSGEFFAANYVKSKVDEKPSVTIFDVGANEGAYSGYLSGLFGTNAFIYSFEPSKKNFEAFRNSTSHITNIIPVNIGLGETAGQSVLYSDAQRSQLSSVYKRELGHIGLSLDTSERIKITTIDHFCKQNNISYIDFLKLDIEGHEVYALRGAREMIANDSIHFIQFEFGGCNIDSRTFFKDFFLLLNEKYKIYRILRDGLYPIIRYDEKYEIFGLMNFLAENRSLS